MKILIALALAAGLVGFASDASAQMRSNGFYDPLTETFVWSGGGEDPLIADPGWALAQERIAEVLPAHVREELLAKMAEARQGPPNHVVQDGDRDDIMLSGRNGWVAMNVVAMPSLWKKGRSRDAWVVYHTDETGRQWRLTFYAACGNVGLMLEGAPLQCRCVPEKGDVCPPGS